MESGKTERAERISGTMWIFTSRKPPTESSFAKMAHLGHSIGSGELRNSHLAMKDSAGRNPKQGNAQNRVRSMKLKIVIFSTKRMILGLYHSFLSLLCCSFIFSTFLAQMVNLANCSCPHHLLLSLSITSTNPTGN